MRRSIFASLLLSTAAFAADARFNINFGNWRVGNEHQTRAYVPSYPVQPSWYWVVYTPPPPPPPPQVIYVEREREPVPEQPMKVVVVQLPPVEAPVPIAAPTPAPVVPVPVAPAPVAPLLPRVPGPDVFQWTDDEGVVNYSTRVPANARLKARKLPTLAK